MKSANDLISFSLVNFPMQNRSRYFCSDFAFCAPQRRKARSESIHGGIPCNLAPAHFTVHVVQVRLNFALGFAVEANPA